MAEEKKPPFKEPAVTAELVASHGLVPEEYQKIVKILGREPNYTELGVFSVMWSEHCSYKSSAPISSCCPPKDLVLQGRVKTPALSKSAVGLLWRLNGKPQSPVVYRAYQERTRCGRNPARHFPWAAPDCVDQLVRLAHDHPRTSYWFPEGCGIGGYGNASRATAAAKSISTHAQRQHSCQRVCAGDCPKEKDFYRFAKGVENR